MAIDKDIKVIIQTRTIERSRKLRLIVTPPSGDRDRLREEMVEEVSNNIHKEITELYSTIPDESKRKDGVYRPTIYTPKA